MYCLSLIIIAISQVGILAAPVVRQSRQVQDSASASAQAQSTSDVNSPAQAAVLTPGTGTDACTVAVNNVLATLPPVQSALQALGSQSNNRHSGVERSFNAVTNALSQIQTNLAATDPRVEREVTRGFREMLNELKRHSRHSQGDNQDAVTAVKASLEASKGIRTGCSTANGGTADANASAESTATTATGVADPNAAAGSTGTTSTSGAVDALASAAAAAAAAAGTPPDQSTGAPTDQTASGTGTPAAGGSGTSTDTTGTSTTATDTTGTSTTGTDTTGTGTDTTGTGTDTTDTDTTDTDTTDDDDTDADTNDQNDTA